MNRKVQKSALRKQRRGGVTRRETINGVPYHHYDAEDSEKHDYADSAADDEEEMEVGSRYGGSEAAFSTQEVTDGEISDTNSSLTVAIKKILRGTKSKLSPQKRKGGEIVERRPSTDLDDGASQSLSSSDRKKVSFKLRDSLTRGKSGKKRNSPPPPLSAYQQPDIPLPVNRRTVGAQTTGLTIPDGLTDKIEQLLQMKLNGGSSEMSLNDRRYLESLLNHSLLGRQATREQWKAPTSDGLALTNLYESPESEDEDGFWSRLYKNNGAS